MKSYLYSTWFSFDKFVFKLAVLLLPVDSDTHVVFACSRTVSIAAAYQLKIKYDQDKFKAVFLDAKRPVSFPLEDKHVVNEYHVVQKSHDVMQKKSGAFRDWFEIK